jgi:hypothetical protein
MPEPAQMETVTIQGRELRIRWKSPRHGEWLAWCYVPSDSGLPLEGTGFEARAETADAARAALLEKVTAHLSA